MNEANVNKRRRTLINALGLGAGMLNLPAAWAQAPAGKPFQFGAVLPLSGLFSQTGKITEQGIATAVRLINAEGGILGRHVDFVTRDDGSNPQRAVLAARELVEEQKVDFLYPELVGANALAILPYTSERKFITMTNSSSPRIGDPKAFPYNFQLGDSSVKRAPSMLAALKKLGGTRIGILVANNPGTLATSEQLTKEAGQWGLQIAAQRVFPMDSKDLTSQMQGLRDAGADIIALDTASREGIPVAMTALQTLGWKARVVSGLAALSGDLKELVPASVQSQFYSMNYRVGTRIGPLKAEQQRFIAEAKKIAPIVGLSLMAAAYDITYMVKWGFEKAVKTSGRSDADAVKAAFENITNSDYPAERSLVLGNPRWRSDDHTSMNADYSKMWALVRVSTPVDGMYEGEALDIPG